MTRSNTAEPCVVRTHSATQGKTEREREREREHTKLSPLPLPLDRSISLSLSLSRSRSNRSRVLRSHHALAASSLVCGKAVEGCGGGGSRSISDAEEEASNNCTHHTKTRTFIDTRAEPDAADEDDTDDHELSTPATTATTTASRRLLVVLVDAGGGHDGSFGDGTEGERKREPERNDDDSGALATLSCGDCPVLSPASPSAATAHGKSCGHDPGGQGGGDGGAAPPPAARDATGS